MIQSDVQDMIQPDSETRRQLYSGTSNEGRMNYLQSRLRRRPESRYLYPVVSSWEYGWRLDPVTDSQRPRAHGRHHVIDDNFYRRNGVPQMYDHKMATGSQGIALF